MIGPSEQPSSPEIFPTPPRPEGARDRRRVILGVLKLGDPLLEIFPGRVVPLLYQDPKLIKSATPVGPRFLACMLAPFDELTPEHKASIVAKVAIELQMPIEAALERLRTIGYYAIQRVHFAGVVEAQAKREEGDSGL